ncbi:MAG: hypothetical protein HZB61_15895 [Nitrospirae bacterium]|nr:hypothetical protein [Nitrospirota bacterium]
MKRSKQLSKGLFFILFACSLILGLGACGGGGGGGSSDGGGPVSQTATGTISGTVSGTTVIAVNDNGDIVASDDTMGKTPDANGKYSFTLTGIPAGVSVRVYLITGGGAFPMYFDSNNDGAPDTNVFSLSSTVNINLGFVDVHVEGQDGKAIPENDPTDTSGVSGKAENTNIPDSITNPTPPSGSSLNDLITGGLNALNSGWMSKANNYFKSAVAKLDGSESPNDADTARFFYAATRIIALGFDITSDGNSGDMNRAGDILDRFGCDADDSKRANVRAVVCPARGSLPNNSPSTTDLKSFSDNLIRPEIEGAIANLGSVSSAFNKVSAFDNESSEFDYGDVLLLRAGLKGELANMDISKAYHQEADIDLELNDINNTIQKFLNNHPAFLTLPDVNRLSAAKTELTGALDDLRDAINSVKAETDNQADDLITLGDWTLDEINQALADVADMKASLSGATMMLDNNPSNPGDEFTLNMSKFFEGPNLRSYLPIFADNTDNTPGMFPLGALTLGGILPNATTDININEDLDVNGTPDILE